MRDLKYDFAAIEPKWQKKWQETGVYQTGNHSDKPKFYALVEFPYPSGQGLHVGHARPYTAMDVVARKRRMDGYNVLFPMGYDAFGLPTENYAIKNHIHPAKVTHDNIENFRRQLQMLGYSFDWSREVNTTDPSYYKWTQWIFLQLYKHGLAYKTTMPVNWCTSCKCVLANEEVVEGVCERCGSPVIRKEKSQWMLKITEYAQRLIDDLDGLDFIERVKTQQKNWIGRSTGAEVTFQATTGDAIVVYTTRPDTLFGATYMVLSPEHELVRKWLGVRRAEERRRRHRLPEGRRLQVRLGAHGAEQGEDRRVPGRRAGRQPSQRQGDPHLHLRLRALHLWHRRHHGRTRPRRPGLGVRQEVRLRDHRGGLRW